MCSPKFWDEMLADANFWKKVEEGFRAIERGEFITLKELKKKYPPTACYYCNSPTHLLIPSHRLRFKSPGKAFYQCPVCSLIQLLPQFSQSEEEEIHQKFSQVQDFVGQKRVEKPYLEIKKYLRKNDTILELGCSTGANLKYYCNIQGCDTDEEAVKLAGANAFNCSADWMLKSNPRKYDFIFGVHVFEHFQNPKKTIELLLGALKPDGRFYFELPCVEDPLLRLRSFNNFYWYDYHSFCYSRKTLNDLFGQFKVSYQIIGKQRYKSVNYLNWLFRGKPMNGNPSFWFDKIREKFLSGKDTLVIVGKKP